jgi:hypothetical protein
VGGSQRRADEDADGDDYEHTCDERQASEASRAAEGPSG